MTNLGPLGFPRISLIGPLVSSTEEFSETRNLNNKEVKEVVVNTAVDNDISRDEISEAEKRQIIDEVVTRTFPGDGAVSRAKRARLAVCIDNRWADGWAKGLGETGTVDPDKDLEMLALKLKGCIGVTESNVPDDERLVPDVFTTQSEETDNGMKTGQFTDNINSG